MLRNRSLERAASAAATLIAAAAVLFVNTQPVQADGPKSCPDGQTWNDNIKACVVIEITTPAPDNPDQSTGGGRPAVCRDKDGSQVPCSKDGLSWWGAPHWCYAQPVPSTIAPKPPAGKKKTDGKWMACSSAAQQRSENWWVDNAELSPVDPVAVATRIRAQLAFALADAKVAPSPPHHTYIRYLNWMWINDNQWGPISDSETVRGATVTLTATPTHVEWNMGNGDTASCVGTGRAWVKGMPENAKTNCSYSYDTMNDPTGDTWTVTARINYTLAWTCTGNCGGQNSGDLGSQLAAAGDPTTITVHQRQTVVKN